MPVFQRCGWKHRRFTSTTAIRLISLHPVSKSFFCVMLNIDLMHFGHTNATSPNGLPFMTIQCPRCSETAARKKLRQPFEYSLGFLVLAFLGGMIGGGFYYLGQESKFECGRCHRVFYSHTTLSRICYVLCIITYTAVVALIAYGLWGSYQAN